MILSQYVSTLIKTIEFSRPVLICDKEKHIIPTSGGVQVSSGLFSRVRDSDKMEKWLSLQCNPHL